MAEVAPEELGLAVADLALAREEDEDVAVGIERGDAGHRVGDRFGEIDLARRRLVEHVHRVGPSLHLDDRRAVEEGGEALGLQGRRADHHLEVRPLRQDALRPAEEEVDGQAALVRLVDDQRVVALEQRVAVDLREEDPVGHELHVGGGRGVIVEADLVADVGAERRAELAGHARGDAGGGDASRLGDPDLPLETAAHGEGDLRQLRRLARAGGAGDDDHRVRVDGDGDVLHPRCDGQLGGKVNRRVAHVGGFCPRLPWANSTAYPSGS